MTRFASLSSLALPLVAALIMSGCGGTRELQKVTISPAAADAKNFQKGQVPFTALGTFSKPPSPVPLTSHDIVWCAGGGPQATPGTSGMCAGNINVGVTVDQNGVAQCVGTFQGTGTILAGTALPVMNPDVGQQMKIFGAAQLTCP